MTRSKCWRKSFGPELSDISCNRCELKFHHGTPEKQSFTKSTVTGELILVGWEGQSDPLNPANQSTGRKLFMTVMVSLIALSVTAASAIDACGVREYSEYFQVSEVVGSLATGMSTPFCFLLSAPSYPQAQKRFKLIFWTVI
jgi:hypothetical protein